MATMWAQITTIISAEPCVFALNAALLICEGIAAGCVAAGIVWESAPPGTWRKRASHKLVIWGVVAEVAFSLVLFISDQIVSGSQLIEIREQQSKIIALETRIAPRALTKEQYAAIQSLHGKVRAVSVLASPDIEPALFASQLEEALGNAGIAINPILNTSQTRWMGIGICFSENNPLWETLTSIGLDPMPSRCGTDDTSKGIAATAPKDVPLIIVGERPLFWPTGKPDWFRYRAYPGLER